MSVKFIPDSDIESKADLLRKQFKMDQAPVDVFTLADLLEIEVFEAEFKDRDTCGMITKSAADGAFRIFVNREHGHSRQRYTVAHELGHFILHKDKFSDPQNASLIDSELSMFRFGPDSKGGPDTRRLEIQANKFAASLLMPRKLVESAFALLGDIQAIADLFEVSRAAMGFRLSSLDLG